MKRIYFFLSILAALPFCCNAQNDLKKKNATPAFTKTTAEEDEVNELVGKWQEFRRTVLVKGKKEQDIPFEDTLKLMLGADSMGYNYLADAKIIHEEYGFVGDKFYFDTEKTLMDFTLEDGIIRMGGPKQYSYLKTVDQYYFAPIKKLVPSETKGEVGKLDETFFVGNWKVYKKTDPAFSRSNVYLYRFEILRQSEDQSFEINVTYDDAGKLITDEGSLLVDQQKCKVNTMQQAKVYTINKASQDELILQDGDVIYFLKK